MSTMDGSRLKKITSLENLVNKITDGKPPVMIKDRQTIRKTNIFASTRQLHGRVLFPHEGDTNDQKLISQDVTTVDTRNESKVDANLSWGFEGEKLQKAPQASAKQPTIPELTKTQEGLLRITSRIRLNCMFLKSASRVSLGPCTSQSLGNKPYVKSNLFRSKALTNLKTSFWKVNT